MSEHEKRAFRLPPVPQLFMRAVRKLYGSQTRELQELLVKLPATAVPLLLRRLEAKVRAPRRGHAAEAVAVEDSALPSQPRARRSRLRCTAFCASLRPARCAWLSAPRPVAATRRCARRQVREWDELMPGLARTWVEVYEKNQARALDHRSFYFKHADKKHSSGKQVRARERRGRATLRPHPRRGLTPRPAPIPNPGAAARAFATVCAADRRRARAVLPLPLARSACACALRCCSSRSRCAAEATATAQQTSAAR